MSSETRQKESKQFTEGKFIFSYVSKPHRSTPWRLPWHDSSKQDLMTGVWWLGYRGQPTAIGGGQGRQELN